MIINLSKSFVPPQGYKHTERQRRRQASAAVAVSPSPLEYIVALDVFTP